MFENKPDSNIITSTYWKGMDRLMYASHWVTLEGEKVKIPIGLKIYYQYRFNRFMMFKEYDQFYNESHLTCAKLLGLSVDTLKKNYNPMLKSMGLMKSYGSFHDKDVIYKMFDLDNVKGWLINEKVLETRQKPLSKKKKKNLSWQELKNLEYNSKLSKQLKDANSKKVVIDLEEYQRLKQNSDKNQ